MFHHCQPKRGCKRGAFSEGKEGDGVFIFASLCLVFCALLLFRRLAMTQPQTVDFPVSLSTSHLEQILGYQQRTQSTPRITPYECIQAQFLRSA